ncbi:MAG TPA: aminoglycoside phosphotransferase family protein [Paenibacillus sp.]|nr:aminoglycoside phosphotransferase family protein [Paenibacillus sp.]
MTTKIGKKLGEGAGSEVYEWDDGNKIVKLAKPNTSFSALERELNHSRIAWECGLPVPEPFELVTIGDRNGIVFERIRGESVLKRLVGGSVVPHDDLFEARLTARLLHQVHSHEAPHLRSQRENMTDGIRNAPHLTESEKEAILADVRQLPMKQRLCHGDPNPGNILLRERDAMLIDWNDASSGNPEADAAEYVLLLRFAVVPTYLNLSPSMSAAIDAKREEAIRLFLEEYEKLSGLGTEEIEPWVVPVAARKLSADAFSDTEKALLVTEIRKRLQNKETFGWD